MSFLSRSSVPFSSEDQNLMDDLARRLGVVAHRGELLRQATEASTGFRAALDAAIDIGSSLDPPQVISRLLKRATEALAADRATLSSVDGEDLVIRGSYAVDGRAFEVGQRFRYAMSPQFLRLLETRQPLHERYRVEDLEADVRPAMEGFQHAITIPMVEEDRVVATLTVSRLSDRSFSHLDTRLLELVAAAAGIALQNASLFEETARSRTSLQLALEAAEDVAAATDISDVVAKLLRRACAAANATEAALGHLEGDEVVIDQATDSRGLGLRWPIGPDTKEALARGRPGQISNPRSLAPSSEHAASTSSDWALSVPLVLEGDVVGMLGLGRRESAFTEDEIDAVRRLSPVAALLVRNARLLEEAREASRAKSEFLNMAGHELRTPLAVVRGYLSLLATGAYGEAPAEWASVLTLLEDKSRELSVMVESILTAARLQSGRLQTSRERVDLVAILHHAVERAAAAAALSGGAVVGRYPHEPIYVEGDPTQLSVIVDNLLANAVKYSSPPAAVTAAVQHRDGAVEVRIADRGRGIPPEHKERIFEEFVRIDNLDRDYPPGTGLGLYIARQLAERYGGSLELEWSEPGRGSTFVLRLPALRSPASPA
jgi:signal transduction histidine kinase